MQLTFENRLSGYIHYCTEIKVNLPLNTCNFLSKFRLIFFLILSENAPNVVLEKLGPILTGPTLNCFRRACPDDR